MHPCLCMIFGISINNAHYREYELYGNRKVSTYLLTFEYLDNGGGGRSVKDLSLLEGLCGTSCRLFSLSDSPEGWYTGLCKKKKLFSLFMYSIGVSI